MGTNDEKWEVHPSYGTAQFNRVHNCGPRRLFGSPVRQHPSTVMLTIRRAKRTHSLSEDWVFANEDIVEVELSASQFAEMLTTMNVGHGVPCTIRFIEGEGRIESPPDEEIEIDRVQQSFKDMLTGMVERILEQKKEMDEILDKKSINKKDRTKIAWIVDKVLQEVQSNMPFVLDQFSEATDRVVTAAKGEVDSFLTNLATQTGMKELREVFSGKSLLGSGEPGE